MQVFKTLAKETLLYGLSYSLGRLLNFLLATSYLSYYVFVVQDGSFSIYTDIYFYIALFLGILGLRMETSLFRFLSKDSQEQTSIYALLSQIVIIACVLFFVLYLIFQKPISDFLQYPENFERCIFISVLIIILDVLSSLPFAKLRYDQKAKQYAWIKLAGILINIVLVIYFFEFYFQKDQIVTLSSSSKIFYILLANFLSSAIIILLLYKEFIKSFQKADWSRVKELFDYAWPLVLVTLMYTIIQNGYISFLKYLLPGNVVDNYNQTDDLSAAFRLAVVMNIFITAFNFAVEPFFFRHSKDKNSKEHYAKLNLFFVIACCIVYILTCTNVTLVAYFVDSQYRDLLHVLPVLLMANIFSGIYTNLSSWYKLTDKTLMAAGISFFGFVLNILLFILLTPHLGVEAAAWISFIVYFVMCVLSVWQGKKHYPIPYEYSKTIFYLLIAIVISYLHNEYLELHPILNVMISLIYVCPILYWAYHTEWKNISTK